MTDGSLNKRVDPVQETRRADLLKVDEDVARHYESVPAPPSCSECRSCNRWTIFFGFLADGFPVEVSVDEPVQAPSASLSCHAANLYNFSDVYRYVQG